MNIYFWVSGVSQKQHIYTCMRKECHVFLYNIKNGPAPAPTPQ